MPGEEGGGLVFLKATYRSVGRALANAELRGTCNSCVRVEL